MWRRPNHPNLLPDACRYIGELNETHDQQRAEETWLAGFMSEFQSIPRSTKHRGDVRVYHIQVPKSWVQHMDRAARENGLATSAWCRRLIANELIRRGDVIEAASYRSMKLRHMENPPCHV